METINVHVIAPIMASVEKVFNAILNARHLNKYFASKSSGNIEEGKTIVWAFEDYNVQCEVNIVKVVEPYMIIFNWEVGGNVTTVTILLESKDLTTTQIDITESTFELSQKGAQLAMGQTQGWTDFICSLKAYLYTGINLRNGQQSVVTE